MHCFQKACAMNKANILALALIAASGSTFAATNVSKPTLTYDRVSLGYVSSSNGSAWNLSGTALLGDSFLVTGTYSDLKIKNSSLSDKATAAEFGYKLNAGSGDVIFSLGFVQSNTEDSKVMGLAWRQLINDAMDYKVGYKHVNGSISDSDMLSFELRYNFSKCFDVTAGYTFASHANLWSLSAGYNF
jgi:hypothetical protein